MGDRQASIPVIPSEMHLKMSKKIAQLTKVIFHLNTRNEDFQIEFGNQKRKYTKELNQITHESVRKIRALQEQYETSVEAMDKMDIQSKKEIKRLKDTITKVQIRAEEAQKAKEEAYITKVTNLADQVEKSKTAFTERIQQLTLTVNKFKNDKVTLQQMKTQYENEIAQIQSQHSEEIAKLVMDSNAKYNDMMAAHFMQNDARKDEFLKAKLLWEQDIQQCKKESLELRAKDKENTLQWWQKEKELTSNVRKLEADNIELKVKLLEIEQEKENLVKTSKDEKMQYMQQQLAAFQTDQEVQLYRKTTEKQIQQLSIQVADFQARIENQVKELKDAKQSLNIKETSLLNTQNQLKVLEAKMAKANTEISEKESHWVNAQVDLEQQIASLLAKLKQETEKVIQIENDYKNYKLSAEKFNLGQEKSLLDLQQKLSISEFERLHAQRDIQSMNDLHKVAIENIAKKLSDVQQTHREELNMRMEQYCNDIENLRTEHATKNKALEEEIRQYDSQRHESQIAQLKDVHLEEINKINKNFQECEQQLTKRIISLEDELKCLKSDSAISIDTIAKLRKHETELTQKTQKAEGQVENLMKMLKAQEVEAEIKLKKSVESLEKKYHQLQSRYDNDFNHFSMERKKYLQDQDQKLSALKETHQKELCSQQRHLEEKYSATLNEVSSTHYAAINEANTKLSDAQITILSLNDDIMSAQEVGKERCNILREDYCATLLQYQINKAAEIQDIIDSHNNKIKVLDQQFEAEIQKVIMRHTSENEHAEQLSKSLREQQYTSLSLKYEEEKKALLAQHAENTKTLKEELLSQYNSQITALQCEMLSQLADLRKCKDEEAAISLNKVRQELTKQIKDSIQEADNLRQFLAQKTLEANAAREEVNKLLEKIDRTKNECDSKLKELTLANLATIESIQHEENGKRGRIIEDNKLQMQNLKEELDQARDKMNDKIQLLLQKVDDWERRYNNRESRQEDLCRINELEITVAEKSALARRTADEMAYIKREFLNREEMYNKTFARTPNVGILQVLKPQVELEKQMQLGVGSSKVKAFNKSHRLIVNSTNNGPSGDVFLRWHSERGTRSTGDSMGLKKSLPPLNNNNQT